MGKVAGFGVNCRTSHKDLRDMGIGAMAGKPKTMAMWARLQSRRDEVFDLVARGTPNTRIAEMFDGSPRILYEWYKRADIEPLYRAALAARASRLAEESAEIADEEARLHPATGAIDPGDIAHRKLRIDTRKWLAGKWAPQLYGESIKIDGKVDVTHHVGSFVDMVRGTRLADESEAIDGESTLIATSSDD